MLGSKQRNLTRGRGHVHVTCDAQCWIQWHQSIISGAGSVWHTLRRLGPVAQVRQGPCGTRWSLLATGNWPVARQGVGKAVPHRWPWLANHRIRQGLCHGDTYDCLSKEKGKAVPQRWPWLAEQRKRRDYAMKMAIGWPSKEKKAGLCHEDGNGWPSKEKKARLCHQDGQGWPSKQITFLFSLCLASRNHLVPHFSEGQDCDTKM